jgi:hypothetical protein
VSKFLTLEGVPSGRRINPLFAGLLDAPPKPIETAATRAAFAVRQDAEMWKGSDEAERQTPAFMKRLEAMSKATEEGQKYSEKESLFTTYEPPKGEKPRADLENIMSFGESLADEGLGWGWRNLRRAFTPPARVRKIFKRVVTPPKTLRKVIRYAGAIATLPYTAFAGKQRNKMFGLKGKEMRVFDAAAKVHRTIQIAVAAYVTGGAISGSMSHVAGGAFTKFLAKSAIKQAIMKGGKFIMKDSVKGEIWSIGKNAMGQIIGSKFSKNQVAPEEYAALPANEPVPVGVNGGPGGGSGSGGAPSGGGFAPGQDESAQEPDLAPSVAGSSTMTPGTQDTPPGYKLGEFTTDKATRADNSEINPLGSYAGVNPLVNDSETAKAKFDEASIEELMSKRDGTPTSEGLVPTDQPLSLAFEAALSQVREIQGGVIRGNRVKRNRAVARTLWGNLA